MPEAAIDAAEREVCLVDRIEELEGDVRRLAQLIGSIYGEPFASHAAEIVEKHQGR